MNNRRIPPARPHPESKKPVGILIEQSFKKNSDRCHLAYLRQRGKLSADNLKQLAEDQTVTLRLSRAETDHWPIVVYTPRNHNGVIYSQGDIENLREDGVNVEAVFEPAVVWNDNEEELLPEGEAEAFLAVWQEVKAVLEGKTSNESKNTPPPTSTPESSTKSTPPVPNESQSQPPESSSQPNPPTPDETQVTPPTPSPTDPPTPPLPPPIPRPRQESLDRQIIDLLSQQFTAANRKHCLELFRLVLRRLEKNSPEEREAWVDDLQEIVESLNQAQSRRNFSWWYSERR